MALIIVYQPRIKKASQSKQVPQSLTVDIRKLPVVYILKKQHSVFPM